MAESTESSRVTLSKADRNTEAGAELLSILTELSADGEITREELERLRAWLNAHASLALSACHFLSSVVETISRDGEITDDELDSVMRAIERVLPPDIRTVVVLERKQKRAAKRAQRGAERDAQRTVAREARERARPLHAADFIVAGASRLAERRDACGCLFVGETVRLEREPDNKHDKNAILVLAENQSELGYVPREHAREMAPLLDAGAYAEATVKKLLETAAEHTLPVVVAKVYRADAERVATKAQDAPRHVAPERAIESPSPQAPLSAMAAQAVLPPFPASVPTLNKTGPRRTGLFWAIASLFGLGRKDVQPAGKLLRPVGISAGRGFNLGVVGESHYQMALARVSAGRRERGEDVIFRAWLVLDVGNQYDANAVAVLSDDGKCIGYLAREWAKEYRAQLAELHEQGKSPYCSAKLLGGCGEKALFGVLLDVRDRNDLLIAPF